MIRYERLITLLTLLHNRNFVTKEQICQACNVSERTAYRYINKLSMSNIPIYFDRSVGGYRLNSPSKIVTNHIGVSDTIIMKCALKYLEQRLEGSYSDAIDSINNILNRINFSADLNTCGFTDNIFSNEFSPEKLSSSIHLAILITAIRNNQKVIVEFSNGSDEPCKNIVEKPILRFASEWQVFDSRAAARNSIPLSKIREVKII
jgi:predicted DNA-binding transcriptional regulator YafY